MARMFPRTLLEADVESDAEKRVFRLLDEQLDDDWRVFHSASWIVRDPAEGARDGEIDFVLCHPDQPILCLEVKGGGIECRRGEWFRIIDGQQQRAKDPFKQALDHRYALERKIAEVDGWKKRRPFIAHAVVLPDVTVHELVLAPDAPPELVLDRNDVQDLPTSLERVIKFHAGAREKRQCPGEEGAKMLQQLLAPDVTLEVRLGGRLADEEAQLITLTDQQASLLRRFAGTPRMRVRGCAGSGKTMLAVEMAKRFGRDGRKVLFVCFNRALRFHLRKQEAESGVWFHTFQGFVSSSPTRHASSFPTTRAILRRTTGGWSCRPRCSRRRRSSGPRSTHWWSTRPRTCTATGSTS